MRRYGSQIGAFLNARVGSKELAEDLAQEVFLRVWKRPPAVASEPQLRAWLYTVASNLAVDAFRERRRATCAELDDQLVGLLTDDVDHRIQVEAVLAELSAHERLLLTLHLGGYLMSEIGQLLCISPEAARKRVSRARERFRLLWILAGRTDRPAVLLLDADDDEREHYANWLRVGGGRLELLERHRSAAQIETVDALLIGSGRSDIDPATYGQNPRATKGAPNLHRDRRDLRIIRSAFGKGMPILAICRGHQLLNVALGGTLHQDVSEQQARRDHFVSPHMSCTLRGTAGRRILGHRLTVPSEHHQSVNRLGAGLRVSSTSRDGVVEMVEHEERRFVVGLQWHPEDSPGGIGEDRIRDALLEHARAQTT